MPQEKQLQRTPFPTPWDHSKQATEVAWVFHSTGVPFQFTITDVFKPVWQPVTADRLSGRWQLDLYLFHTSLGIILMWSRIWSTTSDLICSAKQAIWFFFSFVVMSKYVTLVAEHVGKRRCKYVIAGGYKCQWLYWAWIKDHFFISSADTGSHFYLLWNPRQNFGITWNEPLSINIKCTGIFHICLYLSFVGRNRAEKRSTKVSENGSSVRFLNQPREKRLQKLCQKLLLVSPSLPSFRHPKLSCGSQQQTMCFLRLVLNESTYFCAPALCPQGHVYG